MTDHEHEWIWNRTFWICKDRSCDEEIHLREAQVMLNEHAKLKREIDGIKEKFESFMLADWQFEGDKVPHQWFELKDGIEDTQEQLTKDR